MPWLKKDVWLFEKFRESMIIFRLIHLFPINVGGGGAQKCGKNSNSVNWAQVWLLQSFSLTVPSGSTDR